ncbi:MAG TPA: glycoside hydrolase family 15 protein [Steroidobacteraceae bacterium]|nr:glycoside hydrolase family 15 protein [Steroidobacteraceae bacterium]
MTASLALGVIGNCQVGGLIDGWGRNVWSCLPRFDADPLFCGLLTGADPATASGTFAIELKDAVSAEQRYLRNTAILETVLHDAHGAAVRILDFCPRFALYGRVFRPVMLVRIIEPVIDHPVVTVRVRPMWNYGANEPLRTAGSNHINFAGEAFTLRLTTDASISAVLEERPFVLRERRSFVLGPNEPVTEAVDSLAQRFFDQTHDYWVNWTRGLAIPFEWQEEVIRAAITLKLCTFEDTGAIIAAMTTSVPEAAASGRNWDYRYCWLRDSYFTIKALNRLGATRTMERYVSYIANIVAASDSRPLQPLYGITGEPALDERIVESLPGYRGMGPVRVGNAAYVQTQNDVYGAVILATTQAFFDSRLARPGDEMMFEQLEAAGERCVALYDQPDAGIWEYRGRESVHTFSSVMCWSGVHHLVKIARRLGLESRAEHWQKAATQMHERICSAAWNAELGSFTEGWGGLTVDASLLLLVDLGFLAPDDPRFAGTVALIGERLVHNGYVFRYRTADDFGRPENAFTICTFWYINALVSLGRRQEACALFDRMLSRRNALGLLSEDLDPLTGELWGNFPQTYSLVGIINSAMRLSRSWEEAL